MTTAISSAIQAAVISHASPMPVRNRPRGEDSWHKNHKNEDFESECQDRTHEKTGDYGSAHAWASFRMTASTAIASVFRCSATSGGTTTVEARN